LRQTRFVGIGQVRMRRSHFINEGSFKIRRFVPSTR